MTDYKKDMEDEPLLLTKAASIEQEYQVNNDSKTWTITINTKPTIFSICQQEKKAARKSNIRQGKILYANSS